MSTKPVTMTMLRKKIDDNERLWPDLANVKTLDKLVKGKN